MEFFKKLFSKSVDKNKKPKQEAGSKPAKEQVKAPQEVDAVQETINRNLIRGNEISFALEALKAKVNSNSNQSGMSEEQISQVNDVLQGIQNRLTGVGDVLVDAHELDDAALELIKNMSNCLNKADAKIWMQAVEALVAGLKENRYSGEAREIEIGMYQLKYVKLNIDLEAKKRHIEQLKQKLAELDEIIKEYNARNADCTSLEETQLVLRGDLRTSKTESEACDVQMASIDALIVQLRTMSNGMDLNELKKELRRSTSAQREALAQRAEELRKMALEDRKSFEETKLWYEDLIRTLPYTPGVNMEEIRSILNDEQDVDNDFITTPADKHEEQLTN